MVLGLIPQGYGDGLPRTYQKGGYVLIGGIRRPIVGRISMNMAVVDLSASRIPSSGADVVLIGSQGSEMITPEDHAVITDTIPYEVTTRISPLLPRVLVD